jgi:5'-deoxynucleotidase YfbR-like HD superfamily hydrolase
MALLFGPRLGLNVDKMIRLALIHDLAEARVGDLTPADRVSSAEKRERERIAFAEIVEPLPEGRVLDDLWREYEAGASPEARVVRQLDKLEMALQALEYERQYGRHLDRARPRARRRGSADSRPERGAVEIDGWANQFWDSARGALTEPLLIEFYDYLYALRPRR